MALVVRNCSDQKVTSSLRRNVVVARPFLLKDFLMDDMSSCSSNGFKSYPRRQCCATVRFLIDADLTKGRDRPKMIRSKPMELAEPPPARLNRSRSRAATSALQRASVAVLNAVKLLPFSSVKSNGLLSRRLLKRSFWKRNNGKEEANRRCRLFGELLVEKDKPLDHDQSNTITDTAAIATCSNNFDEVDLNSTTQDDAVLEVTEATPNPSPSSVQNAEVWQNHEEKEQFSPVSVLDCPFKDEEEEEESGSQFQLSLARVEEGRSNKQKMRRFEGGMARELEPLNLEKRISLSEHRTSISTNVKVHEADQEKLEALLNQVKSDTCHPSDGSDNLLLDFFEDNVSLSEREALTLARDWVNGTSKELVLGWEVQEGRDKYVEDMDKERGWRGTTSFEDREGVALELDCEVWSCLVNELVLDLF